MGPQAEDYIETVLTCEGDFYDPEFHTNLKMFSNKLEELILQDKKKKKLILKKVEPWNSVKVTFNIPKEAALRLKCLAEQGDNTLKELGILAVEIEGDRKISLKIAGKNNETTELVFRTNPTGASAMDTSKSEDIMGGPSNLDSSSSSNIKTMADCSGQPNMLGNILEPSADRMGHTNFTNQGRYFNTTPQVSPKFPTPPPSVSTPNSLNAKGNAAIAVASQLLGSTSQATMETMVKLLSGKTSVTSPLLVDLLQNDLVAGHHSVAFSQALSSMLPQSFNSVVAPPTSVVNKEPFLPDEGISLQPPAKKKRKVRKPKERDNSKLKKEKRDQETKHVIQNILNQAVSAGVQQDRVPPIINEQFSGVDSSDRGGSSTQQSSRAGTPAKSPVPKSPIQLSLAPGQRHIINPITGQLELVDDDLNATPPKIDSMYENKGHLMSPKGRNVVPSFNRSPVKAQFVKQSPLVYDRIVPNSPRSSPPIVSVKNDLRDPNTLATRCDPKSSNMDITLMSHSIRETQFMQPSACNMSSAVQTNMLKPPTSANLDFLQTCAGDLPSSTGVTMSQSISAILSNVSKSSGFALATLNPSVHDSLLNPGISMHSSAGQAMSTVPYNVHGSAQLLINNTTSSAASTIMSTITPSDLVSFPRKDSTAVVEPIRQSRIPSVLLEADSSGDSNTSTQQSGINVSEPQPTSFVKHGIVPPTLHHTSHIDNNTGSSSLPSQVQGAIHVNSVEGPNDNNSVLVNSNVSSSSLSSVNVSTPSSPSVNVKSLKSIPIDLPSVRTVPPTMSLKPNGTSRFLNQVQNKSSGELVNHDSELSSHSSDDHVKQGSIDSGLGLGDIKVNSGESPSGSSGNDSPGIMSSSGNRDSDSEKDRDFALSDGKQNVITIGYVLSKEEHPPSKKDLLDHLEKYSQNNLELLQKENSLAVIESKVKDANDSHMKLPTLIKLQDMPYSKADSEMSATESSRLGNSLDAMSRLKPGLEVTKKTPVNEQYQNNDISMKAEPTVKSDNDLQFAEERTSMVQVCSNESEVLNICKKEDVKGQSEVKEPPENVHLSNPEASSAEGVSQSASEVQNSTSNRHSQNGGSALAARCDQSNSGHVQEVQSYSSSRDSNSKSDEVTANHSVDFVLNSLKDVEHLPESSTENSVNLEHATNIYKNQPVTSSEVLSTNLVLTTQSVNQVSENVAFSSLSTDNQMQSKSPIPPSAKTQSSSKPLLIPVNSNNNITISALEKHMIPPISSATFVKQYASGNHEAPMFSVQPAAVVAVPFKGGQMNYAPNPFITTVSSELQSNADLLAPSSSILQIPIQPVLLHPPLAKGFVVNSSRLNTEQVSMECLTNPKVEEHFTSNSGKVVVSSCVTSSGKLENTDTKHLFSTLATTLSYTQAGMTSSGELGILPSAGAKFDHNNLSLPSVMTQSHANIPLFPKCTSTAPLKPGHQAMASLGPSPIMSTGLPYLSTPASVTPLPLTPPAELTADGKLIKGGGIPKGISIMKPLRDRESNMEEDLLESPIKDRKSPRKSERSEKPVFHKRGNFTVAQLLDEAEKAKQNQALLKPCITSDNNENLSTTYTPIVNTTSIQLKNVHKSVDGQIENLLTSSSSKSVPNMLQSVNLTKTEEFAVVLKTSSEALVSQSNLMNAQSTKTVVSHQSVPASSELHINPSESVLSVDDPTASTSHTNLVSSSISDTTSVVAQARSQASDSDSNIGKQESQPKSSDNMLLVEKTVANIEKNDNVVKVVMKNSFKGEFLKIGTGSTGDCSNVKIEPANLIVKVESPNVSKEKSSPKSTEKSALPGVPHVAEVEQSEQTKVQVAVINRATPENSPTKSHLSQSAASLVHEHSYSVSPHKSIREITKEKKLSSENSQLPTQSKVNSESQNHCNMPVEISECTFNTTLNAQTFSKASAASIKSDLMPSDELPEEIVFDSEHHKEGNSDILASRPTFSPVTSDTGKTLLYVGASGSSDPKKVTLDLRSAVTHPAGYAKFIKLEPGSEWTSKPVHKLTSNITVKVTNEVGKEETTSNDDQNKVVASASFVETEVSCSGASQAESKEKHSETLEFTQFKTDIPEENFEKGHNRLGNNIELENDTKGFHKVSEKVTSRRKSTPEIINKAPEVVSYDIKYSGTASIESSIETGEDVKPGQVTRRGSRGSTDSKASSTDSSKYEDGTSVRLNLRARTKRISENSESGMVCVGQTLSRGGSLERSASPSIHSTKPTGRYSRRKEKNAVQDLPVSNEQPSAESQQSRATRSSKRKHPINDDDVEQLKKVKVLENCNANFMVEEGSVKETSPPIENDRKFLARGKLGRNKSNSLEPESEDLEKPEEKDTVHSKRSTRSAHTVEHCELPNKYTTKKKQKSH